MGEPKNRSFPIVFFDTPHSPPKFCNWNSIDLSCTGSSKKQYKGSHLGGAGGNAHAAFPTVLSKETICLYLSLSATGTVCVKSNGYHRWGPKGCDNPPAADPSLQILLSQSLFLFRRGQEESSNTFIFSILGDSFFGFVKKRRYSDGFSGVSECGGASDTQHHAQSLPRQDPAACGSPVAAEKRPLSPGNRPRQDRTAC